MSFVPLFFIYLFVFRHVIHFADAFVKASDFILECPCMFEYDDPIKTFKALSVDSCFVACRTTPGCVGFSYCVSRYFLFMSLWNPGWGPDPNWLIIIPSRAHTSVFPGPNYYRVWTEVRAHYSLDDGLEMVWSDVNLAWKVWTLVWRWSNQMSIWSEKSGRWSGDGLIRCQFGLKSLDDGLEMVWSDVNLVWKVWTMIWRWSDQMSIWSEKSGSWSEMVWLEVNLVWKVCS